MIISLEQSHVENFNRNNVIQKDPKLPLASRVLTVPKVALTTCPTTESGFPVAPRRSSDFSNF